MPNLIIGLSTARAAPVGSWAQDMEREELTAECAELRRQAAAINTDTREGFRYAEALIAEAIAIADDWFDAEGFDLIEEGF